MTLSTRIREPLVGAALGVVAATVPAHSGDTASGVEGPWSPYVRAVDQAMVQGNVSAAETGVA